MRLRLFRRKQVWCPTWLGTTLILVTLVLVMASMGRYAHRFLAIHDPTDAKLLVVEGWAPDYVLEQVVEDATTRDDTWTVVGGGPIAQGYLVSGYTTYAELAADTLRVAGANTNRMLVAPAPQRYRHRTYESAAAVRKKLAEAEIAPRALNVVTVGVHARRTRSIYRKVFGPEWDVGVITYPSRDYDAERWWSSSAGLKTTVTEGLGWFYEFLFDSGR